MNRHLRSILLLALALSLLPVAMTSAQKKKRKPRFTEYPVKPYCTECLKKNLIPGPEKKIRIMEFEGQAVLDHIRSRHVIYIETDDFKLVSTIPGYKINQNTTSRLLLELPMLKKRFPGIKGKMPRLNRHHVAHLIALHLHRVKLEFWELFKTRATSYSGIMNRDNKHEIYVFSNQRDYDRFTDRFTGVKASGGQEIILHADNAVGFVRPPPPRAGLNTWNNTIIHMWAHLLLECQIRNGYNMPSWLDAGFAHWWERREHGNYNTYCYSESREVGIFGSGKWRQRVRRLITSGKALSFPDFFDIKDMSSLNNRHHGLAFSILDFIINTRKKELRKFVRALGATDHVDQYQVFQKSFNRSVPAFDEEWRAWVRKTYPKR